MTREEKKEAIKAKMTDIGNLVREATEAIKVTEDPFSTMLLMAGMVCNIKMIVADIHKIQAITKPKHPIGGVVIGDQGEVVLRS